MKKYYRGYGNEDGGLFFKEASLWLKCKNDEAMNLTKTSKKAEGLARGTLNLAIHGLDTGIHAGMTVLAEVPC